MAHKRSLQMIAEMREFATFSGGEQRYIRRSLDVAERGAAAAATWSRHSLEQASVETQARLYRGKLAPLRELIPDDIAIDEAVAFTVPLVTLSAFDLGEGKLVSFAAYRFLYERLLGGAVRPWLPSAFLSAAALPHVNPSLRKALLRSMTEGDLLAAGWSSREAAFTPAWVEKVPVTVA